MIKGSDIRDARNRAGISQEQLAERVGVTLRTIGNWERSATAPRDKLPILREILGDYLDDGESDSPRLRIASDQELLNEIARRFARSLQKGGSDGLATDAQKNDGQDDGGEEAGGATVTPIKPNGPKGSPATGPEPPLAIPADQTPGEPSQYEQVTREQDEAGEESQDPDDASN